MALQCNKYFKLRTVQRRSLELFCCNGIHSVEIRHFVATEYIPLKMDIFYQWNLFHEFSIKIDIEIYPFEKLLKWATEYIHLIKNRFALLFNSKTH